MRQGDKRFFTEVRKLAGFLLPVEASPTPPLNHEATARPLRQGVDKAGAGPRRGLSKPRSLGVVLPSPSKVVNSKPLTNGAGSPPQSPRRDHQATPTQAV